MPGAIVMGGFAPHPPHPFLVLIQEKGAKENQAPTGGGEAGRVLNGAIEMVPDGGGRRAGAIVGRQGRGELHSPQHVPTRDGGAWRLVTGKWVSIEGGFVPGAIVGRQGRGELHSPQHVPTRDGGARPTMAGKWVSIGGSRSAVAGKLISIGGEQRAPAGKIKTDEGK